MSRSGVTEDQVREALAALQAEGIKTTNEAVRSRTGGSFSTISRHMNALRAQRSGKKLPDRVEKAVEKVNEEIQTAADQVVEEVRQEADVAIDAARARQEVAETALKQAVVDLAGAREQLTASERTREDLRVEAAREREQRLGKEGEAEVLQEHLTAFEEREVKLQAQLEQAAATAAAREQDLIGARERVQAELGQTADQLRAQRERADGLAEQLGRTAADLAQAQEAQRGHIEARAEAQRLLDQAGEQLRAQQTRGTELQEQLATAGAELATTRETLAQQQARGKEQLAAAAAREQELLRRIADADGQIRRLQEGLAGLGELKGVRQALDAQGQVLGEVKEQLAGLGGLSRLLSKGSSLAPPSNGEDPQLQHVRSRPAGGPRAPRSKG